MGKYLLILSAISCFIFMACTTIDVKPKVTDTISNGFGLHGPVDYDRNWDYVPRTISNKKGSPSGLSFKYIYNIKYSGTTMHQDLMTLYIPTSILGTPTGRNDVQVSAQLDVYQDKSIVKSYISVCYVSKTRGMLIGGINYTELRKKGLMAVKENIESQMVQDKEFLLSFVNVQSD